jgi:hypothetical protein
MSIFYDRYGFTAAGILSIIGLALAGLIGGIVWFAVTVESNETPPAEPTTVPIDAEIVDMPDGYSNIAVVCDENGNRVYAVEAEYRSGRGVFVLSGDCEVLR